tara:strand:- start:889 stop:1242 length:354 start_codon:yes stop_codon:yes gene_type:complete
MKEHFLQVNSKDLSLNGAYLSVFEGEKETVLIESIKQATKKGWLSSKKIFEDLDVLYKESDCDLIITEDCANMLIEKYGNVKVKVFTQTPDYYTPFSASHAIANFITKNGTDPYDVG